MSLLYGILAFVVLVGAMARFNISVGYLVLIPFLALPVWLGLVLIGSDERANAARAAAKKVLMADEAIVGQALQHRAAALRHRRVSLLITNSRVIQVTRGLLGGFKMRDIQWKDLLDVTIEQNIFGSLLGSNLKFAHAGRGPAIEVRGVPNQVAATMYAKAQYEEQAWEEKRRVRIMEQARAAAGGVVVHAGGGGGAATTSDRLEEIGKAKALLDAGAVSDAEYQEMKAKILAG